MPDFRPSQKVFGSTPEILTEGEEKAMDARGMVRLTVITDGDATATVSRVDDSGASAHTTGEKNVVTVEPDTRLVLDVDWPFYFVSVADGECRVALV